MSITTFIGLLAACFTTACFVPQVIKTWRTGSTSDISLGTFAALTFGADQLREEFYVDVCAYVRGEPNNIRPGTIGEIEAQIAKKLVEKDPAFMRPENKEKLLVEMRAIYDRDHVVAIPF